MRPKPPKKKRGRKKGPHCESTWGREIAKNPPEREGNRGGIQHGILLEKKTKNIAKPDLLQEKDACWKGNTQDCDRTSTRPCGRAAPWPGGESWDAFWLPFGPPFGSIWLPLGSFGLPLGSVWLLFGSLLGPSGSKVAPFGSISGNFASIL